ncbi:MAG TPA: bifunctional diguanylate cyclase/phosphodiesterase, partial [Mycobacteriales bacterium]|nr:bifunctional diguanylate cyclase/phosphodiesterase [Mycobacteriales bacterium]
MSVGAVAEDSPSSPWLGRRQQRVLWILWIALVVVLVGYAVTTVPGARHHRGYNALIDGWLQNGILVAAALLVAARAALTRSNRLAWSCIAIGIGLYAAGNIIYFGWVQYDAIAHSPSVADIAWLAVYGLLYVGVTGLARPRVHGLHRTLWLDGLVGGLGVIAVATVWLQFLRTHTDGPRGAVLTALAYPVGDLILLVLVIGTCGLLGWRADRQWLCLGAGILMFAAADTIYALRVATDSYRAGTLLDPMWAVAVVVIAAAALSASAERQVARADGWSLLVVPSVFVLAALGLLVYGTWRHLPFLSVALATGTVLAGLTRAGLTFRDVRFLAASRVQARTDELTGLGNRRHFHEVLAARIAALTPDQHLAVLLLDLDRFKEVNDGLGHSVGDLLLVDVGERLSQVLRGGDLLVRLGGDEFALMLASSSPADALALAERLRTGLQAAFVVDGMTIYVDASIGIALCPDVAMTVEGLLQRADIAMYTAKTNRFGAYVYQASADDDLKARLRRVEELGHAINEGQLVLHYQPKVELRTGRIDGAEALVRWNHPEHGLLYPDAFLPDAERYGFMRGLTTCVLGIGLDQVQQWRSEAG